MQRAVVDWMWFFLRCIPENENLWHILTDKSFSMKNENVSMSRRNVDSPSQRWAPRVCNSLFWILPLMLDRFTRQLNPQNVSNCSAIFMAI